MKQDKQGNLSLEGTLGSFSSPTSFRTETIRSCSVDTFNFTKAMVSPDVTDDKRYELLNKALQGHVKYTSDAVNAKGCDRHLLGLKILATQVVYFLLLTHE